MMILHFLIKRCKHITSYEVQLLLCFAYSSFHIDMYIISYFLPTILGKQITLCRDGMENYVQMDDRNQRKTGFAYMYGPVLQFLKFSEGFL